MVETNFPPLSFFASSLEERSISASSFQLFSLTERGKKCHILEYKIWKEREKIHRKQRIILFWPKTFFRG